VRVLLLIGIVGVILALYAADRLVKARARTRRRRTMSDRLTAVTVRADEQQEQRQAAEQAGAELTSFMPAIQRPPADLPGVPPHGPVRPQGARDRAAQREATRHDAAKHDHDAGRAPRRAPRSGEHKARGADRSPHGDAARTGPQRDGRPAV
jgi:hypothetical protein